MIYNMVHLFFRVSLFMQPRCVYLKKWIFYFKLLFFMFLDCFNIKNNLFLKLLF